jgi:hypothetical protein
MTNKLIAICIFLIYSLFHAAILLHGSINVSDREYYVSLFSDPDTFVRMEEGYVFIARIFNFFNINEWVSIISLNLFSSWLFFKISVDKIKGGVNSLVIFYPSLIFGFISIFGFAQFRAYLAIAMFFFIAVKYVNSKTSTLILILLPLASIHLIIFPFLILLVFLREVKITFIIFIIMIVFTFAIISNAGALLQYFGFDDYYIEYFTNDSNFSDLRYSPTIIFMFFLIIYCLRRKLNDGLFFSANKFTHYFLLYIILISIFTGISLFIKATYIFYIGLYYAVAIDIFKRTSKSPILCLISVLFSPFVAAGSIVLSYIKFQ